MSLQSVGSCLFIFFPNSTQYCIVPTISSLRVLNSTSHLKIAWTSSRANNIMLHYWTADAHTQNTISTISSPYNITKLESNTHYKVQLIAENEEGTAKSPVLDGCTTPEGKHLYNIMYDVRMFNKGFNT